MKAEPTNTGTRRSEIYGGHQVVTYFAEQLCPKTKTHEVFSSYYTGFKRDDRPVRSLSSIAGGLCQLWLVQENRFLCSTTHFLQYQKNDAHLEFFRRHHSLQVNHIHPP